MPGGMAMRAAAACLLCAGAARGAEAPAPSIDAEKVRELVAAAARRSGGRFQVVSVDIDTNPGLRQAFAVERVPMTVALLQGQPIPLFLGALPDAELDKVVEQ
ncbi:MAG: hypothetical protein GYA73_06285, partial [Planctomycetes bacterium]|nr:hypothetical protein [Planctomycetota bacterium]